MPNSVERLKGFEAQTQWHDPASPDRIWVGRMVYAPTDGVNIEAYIPAKDTEDSLALPVPEFDTITGTGYDGTPYTGVQAFILNSMSHLGVSQELHIYANELVCGVRLTSRSDRVFTSMMVSSPALTQWAVPRRIRRQKRKSGFGFSYMPPKDRTIELDNVGSGSLTWHADIRSEVATGDINASNKACLDVRFRNARNIDEIIDLVYALDLYFCFAATIFSGPSEVYLSTESAGDPLRPIQLLLHAPWYESVKQVHPLHQYFCIAHLKPSAGRSLSGWLDAFNCFGHALNPYFIARTTIKEATTKFLYYAQSVEALARELFPLPELTEAEAKSLDKAVKAGIRVHMHEDFRKRFGSRIYSAMKGVGRAQFRERLIDLSTHYESDFRELCPQFEKIVPKIVEWRNNLTHRNPIIGLSREEVRELQIASEALRLAAELMILTLAGVPPDANKPGLGRSFYHSFRRSARGATGAA